jgi:hypothetical protein
MDSGYVNSRQRLIYWTGDEEPSTTVSQPQFNPRDIDAEIDAIEAQLQVGEEKTEEEEPTALSDIDKGKRKEVRRRSMYWELFDGMCKCYWSRVLGCEL